MGHIENLARPEDPRPNIIPPSQKSEGSAPPTPCLKCDVGADLRIAQKENEDIKNRLENLIENVLHEASMLEITSKDNCAVMSSVHHFYDSVAEARK